MRTHPRVRRLALAALCAGGTIGAAGMIAAPGQALAASNCSTIFGSGSTLQTHLQQNLLTNHGYATLAAAFSSPVACTALPAVHYNTDTSGTFESGTGSGAGLNEFALNAGGAITPADSSNGTFLDGYIGTDDPPTSADLSNAQTASGTNPETVPVFTAPVAILVNLPAGCTVTAQPVLTNTALNDAYLGKYSWSSILTNAAGTSVASGSTCKDKPAVQVRSDNSGTSFTLKQYLGLIDKTDYTSANINDQPDWPYAGVQTTYTSGGVVNNDKGSSGEVAAVASTPNSIGYANTADAVADAAAGTFADWTPGTSTFWVELHGTQTTGAQPDKTSGAYKTGSCPTTAVGTLPTVGTDDPDYSSVRVSQINPGAGTYPLCALTYDVAWESYSGSVLGPLYDQATPGAGETDAGAANTTKDYLTWVLGGGQTDITTKSTGQYYSKLPTNLLSVAQSTVADFIGQS